MTDDTQPSPEDLERAKLSVGNDGDRWLRDPPVTWHKIIQSVARALGEARAAGFASATKAAAHIAEESNARERERLGRMIVRQGGHIPITEEGP